LFTGTPSNSIALSAEYNLIERVVVFHPQRALHPNTLYTAEVVPSSNPNTGFWAFDRAPLAAGAVPLRFSFSTGLGPLTVAAPPAPVAETCGTLLAGPLAACASCHTTRPGDETVPPSKYPPMGLDLSSPAGLYYTALSHVAHEVETGDTAANDGLQSAARFGVQMNVVDPGNPANSYLMYKLLAKPDNYQLDPSEADCGTGFHPPVSDGNCLPPSDSESSQLREWFVRGDPMPKSSDPLGSASISHAGLLRIAAWIGGGASCD
jgi:hypothetical protein